MLEGLAEAHPVDDASGMEVFYTAQHLVQEVGQPLVIQLHLYDLTQVGVHQLHDQVSDKEPTQAFKTPRKTERRKEPDSGHGHRGRYLHILEFFK